MAKSKSPGPTWISRNGTELPLWKHTSKRGLLSDSEAMAIIQVHYPEFEEEANERQKKSIKMHTKLIDVLGKVWRPF